ncbi:MAG: TetR/AcrR family transcriptional regulator [Candidatus Marinimicrobia bacterium]|jgi:AcrR family transcriptional regulator|nr:TetR/AcrR family transcriptional regulator [Candidatus Neomarinimicrobiota bacterium]MBT3634803.1 TetR/AcrR family transcriptional regulator [Candidatus Neomarinimicrobiota bacterium]MBT3683583.1 TetR/AcrR family transcriptional regulator [Candidatus Neomarinimicrobiota bacterium]MBT3760456.1 TetR/AcrR family transcriptional regulator [Candidatus Neomarinimicrobiota bacterium]MBT3896602.1 TetR/AcrR family transcriptional regulator [Candidatus Neomarinimicrobiota bacterium]
MDQVKRKTSAERQVEIIQAVLKIIGEQGFSSLKTNSIAAEVGISSGAIFRHFSSLENIFRQVVIYCITKIEETFPDTSLPPLERLKTLITNRVMLFDASPGLAWLLRSEQSLLILPEDSVVSLKEMTIKSKNYILDLLKEGMASGIIRTDIEAKNLLIPVVGTTHTIIGIHGISSGESYSKTEFDQALLALERLITSPDQLD